MPVTEYSQRLKVLQKMANKDCEIARQRESSLTRTGGAGRGIYASSVMHGCAFRKV